MMSCMSFIMMLIIMIIIPTILYIFFFLINYKPNPFEFLSRNRDVETMIFPRRSNKILDEEDYDDDDENDSNNKDKNNIELVIASSLNMGIDGECPICLACFVQGEELRQLKLCKHLFHRSCIDKWLSTSCNCPVCRDFVENHCKHIKEKQHNNSNNHNINNNNHVVASRDVDRDDLWQGLPDSAGLV